jgi:methionyl-tRNA synthetase
MKFYVTTPIYYVNDQPHIGHAYTTIAADVLARFNRMRGHEVFFLTGTDEHGQKVEQAAKAKDRTPKEHADLMVENFKGLWEKLGITNDAFIRTTDTEHITIVRDLMQRLFDKGEIVRKTYVGWYCTPDERFWTSKDLVEGNCPDCGRPVEKIEEDNYFFLMSKYHDQLIKYIEDNPGYILPETRRNEVLGFLRSQELGDLCISRPKHRLHWGIPLPFDEEYVTYVWFDALINYYSATRYLAPLHMMVSGKPFETGRHDPWPANHHIIGKDILTTHAVYWSTMLMALGLELPRNIFAHGWWTIEGRKMSKSLGNVVDPVEMSDTYGNDAFRYFLLREVTFGLDGDFSEHAMVGRINTELANDFGNLASRVMKMAGSYFDSEVPLPAEPTEIEHEMKALAEGILGTVAESLYVLKYQVALDEIWKLVSFTNKYIDSSAPWALAKDPEQRPRLATVIYCALEALRQLSLYLHPVLPDATAKLHAALGCEGDLATKRLDDETAWGGLKPGTKLGELPALFPRIDTKKQAAPAKQPKEKKPQKEKKVSEEKKEEAKDNLIKIDDFAKVELKTAKVLKAERIEGADRLLRLEVNSGEPRQIVAGIALAYEPEYLVGKTVIVVANLKPAKLRGVESQGMLLAATGEDGKPVILTTDSEVVPGLRVK